MATLVTEPASSNPQTVDWQAAISKVSKISRGLGAMITKLTNMDTALEPQVASGTRFELSAVLYECSSNESITGWAGITTGAIAYVYAVPGATISDPVTFIYSSTEPTFSVSLGGWYNGANRALFVMYKKSATEWSYKQNIDVDYLIPIRTSDPASPVVGQIWLRVDML